MSNFNFDREWKFIESEKRILDKRSLEFELLAIAQILLMNYAKAETKKVENFYKTVYLKSRNFYLCKAGKVKI